MDSQELKDAAISIFFIVVGMVLGIGILILMASAVDARIDKKLAENECKCAQMREVRD